MASHAELVPSGLITVHLPPKSKVVAAAASSLIDLTYMRNATCGGTHSINVACLLATFPLLYDAPSKPWDKYIEPDRGVPGKDGSAIEWDAIVEVDAEQHLLIVKVALGLMYHVICRPQQNPKNQINKRFSALYATVFPAKQAPSVELDPALDIKATADWLNYEGLDLPILNTLLFVKDDDLHGKTSRAFITQLKLFASFAEMTPFVVMKSLINEGVNHIIAMRPVSEDAAKLLATEKELISQHSREKFPFLKVLRLEGHERITPQAFPNLFRAASMWKRNREGTFRDYRMTKELQADTSEQDVEEVMMLPPVKKRNLLNINYDSLKAVYGLGSDEINQILGIKPKENESDKERERDRDRSSSSYDLLLVVRAIERLAERQDEMISILKSK